MLIELIGCTGAGKSTLLQALLQACRAEGVAASSGEDYLLGRAGLGWVRAPIARSFLLDLVALPFALLAWRANRGFLRLASGVISGLPGTVPWRERLNIARNVLKKVGLYEAMRRALPADQLVIIDEGTVHTAHYLFVHTSTEPPRSVLVAFASLVPLPDVLVLLREQDQVLVSRTLERGHKRIPAASPELVQLFIRRAVSMFDTLAATPMLRDRMFVVNGNGIVSLPEPGPADPGHLSLLGILRKALGIARLTLLPDIASSKPNEAVVVSNDTGID